MEGFATMIEAKLTKKDRALLSMGKQGWIPYQVVQTDEYVYLVNSGSTIGHRHQVKANPVLGLTCSHEYGEYNDFHPCNHIRAVQEHLLSANGFVTFDQEVHVKCYSKALIATKTKKPWEWLITDSRGMSIGCMGVTVDDNKAIWWTTYEGNSLSSWDNCSQAIEYLLAVISF